MDKTNEKVRKERAALARGLTQATMSDSRAFSEFDLDGNQSLDFEEFYRRAALPTADAFAFHAYACVLR